MPDLTLVIGPTWARFSKLIGPGPKVTAGDQLPTFLTFEDADITDIQDLFEILKLLRTQQSTCIIRGQLIAGTEQPCRRLVKPRTENGVDYAATIEDVPRRWLALDFDSTPEPEGVSFVDNPSLCAERVRAALPLEFQSAACVWRASGSAGIKPGVRLHLWFLLDRALDGAQCKQWLDGLPVDMTLFGAVQPHFIADPVFVDVPDPMVERVGLLRGLGEVAVPPVLGVRSPIPTVTHADPGRAIDPFLAAAIRKWEDAHPWVEPSLSDRFECTACGSSDGCALLPDGKLFCHGNKHRTLDPMIGHEANNGYVMHRFEAVEGVPWTNAIAKLQELGFMPGPPKLRERPRDTASTVDAAVDTMTAVAEGRAEPETIDTDLGRAKRARKELREICDHIRIAPSRLEALAFEYARKYVPGVYPAHAVQAELLQANRSSKRPGDSLREVDAVAAIERAFVHAANDHALEAPASALNLDLYGKPERCAANVIKLLQLPCFAEVLGWDERARKKMVLSAPPWLAERDDDIYPRPVNDADYFALIVYLADRLDYPHATVSGVADAMALSCLGQPFDPVVDYLDALPAFDGSLDDARRIAGCWLHEFALAPDDVYTRAVAMRWLIAAVARAYHPGCQQREVLTLLGPQNKGKSKLLRALCAGPWFKDDFNIFKDPAQSLLGYWICEIAEVDRVLATDNHGAIKSFISTAVDNYRRPYGREFETIDRRSLFAATANPSELFRDPTGSTRFNVVVIGSGALDADGLGSIRDELWSAARMLHKSGEQHWLTPDEQVLAVAMQEAHREVFDTEEYLRELIDRPTRLTELGLRFVKGQIVDGRLQWLESSQAVSYLRACGVTRGLFRSVKQAMASLGWSVTRHVGDPHSGPRGYIKSPIRD